MTTNNATMMAGKTIQDILQLEQSQQASTPSVMLFAVGCAWAISAQLASNGIWIEVLVINLLVNLHFFNFFKYI
jgi:hypothetical protein